MPSRGVSFIPPFLALVSGVRMARVMTTSSGFFCVLSLRTCQPSRLCHVNLRGRGEVPYILSMPFWVGMDGVMCWRTEERRWAAIVVFLRSTSVMMIGKFEIVGGRCCVLGAVVLMKFVSGTW